MGIETQKRSSGKVFNESRQQQLPKLEWLKNYQGKLHEWAETVCKLHPDRANCFVRTGLLAKAIKTLEKQFQEQRPEAKICSAYKTKK